MIFVDYPGHFVAGLLVAVLFALTFLAFRMGEMQNAKLRRYRLPLILLQYGSILILLLILWNPSRAKVVSKTLSNNSVLAIFDTSESMSVVEDGQLTRLDKALNVFKEEFQSFDDDGAGYRMFGFDSQSYHSGSRDFLRRWGTQTDLHSVFATLGRYDLTEEPLGASDTQSPNNRAPQPTTTKDKVIGAIIFTDGQANDKNIATYLPLANEDFQTVVVGVGSKDKPADIAV
ncbi:MAG: hypothetical protein JSW59_13700, partial [Phycisphaerales bacterium]